MDDDLREPRVPDPQQHFELRRARLGALLTQVTADNPFYRRKLAGFERFDARRDDLADLPFTTRAEIEADQRACPPYGTNLTYELPRYTRLHQTSGSLGTPLRWLDTQASWEWWKHCWRLGLGLAGLRADDRVFFPFSFGPFIGFWSAFEACSGLGNLSLTGGGMSSAARLAYLIEHRVSVICCTPTYALHLADAARATDVDLAASAVRLLIVAGEPGGSLPGTRRRIEQAWGARVIDHAGATECGAWGFEPLDRPGGLRVLDSEFIVEAIDPQTTQPVRDGERGELVVTNLGRVGSPLIRYRTGDLVVLQRGAGAEAWCAGGVLGRCDDMLTIRGNNVYPGAVESILRELAGVAEFRLSVERRDGLDELRIEIEPADGEVNLPALLETVRGTVRDRLHFRALVEGLAPGTLPRFEFKARRWTRTVPRT